MLLLSLCLHGCNTAAITTKGSKIDETTLISYNSIVNEMSTFNTDSTSTKEMMMTYVLAYLSEGLRMGRILKGKLDKYNFLIECHVSDDGRMQDASIKNSSPEGSNDESFIEYLMQMPQCEFWNTYNGPDKEEITSFVIPVRF